MADGKLRLTTVVDQLFAENTYITHLDGSNECLVIDPGLEVDRILEALDVQSLTPAAILNTHGHADHIAGNAALKNRWPDVPLVIGEGDAHKLSDAAANLSAGHGLPVKSPPADILVKEPESYVAAGIELQIMHTPGHSVGHIVYLWKDGAPWILFGGDVLFQGSIGRTDFPDGSFDDLRDAIHEKLFVLPDATIVLPGHGLETTIGEEKRSNPFVGLGSK